MPTNPLPKGSCNVAVNMPKAARDVVGELAFSRDQYLGEFIRGLLRREVARAAADGELPMCKAKKFFAALGKSARLSVFAVLFLGSILAALSYGGGRVIRRPSGNVARVVRCVPRKIGEWEAFPV